MHMNRESLSAELSHGTCTIQIQFPPSNQKKKKLPKVKKRRLRLAFFANASFLRLYRVFPTCPCQS